MKKPTYYFDEFGMHLIDDNNGGSKNDNGNDGMEIYKKRTPECDMQIKTSMPDQTMKYENINYSSSKTNKCNCPRSLNYFTSKYCDCNKPEPKKVKKKKNRITRFGNCKKQLHINGNDKNIKYMNFCYPIDEIITFSYDNQTFDEDSLRVGMDVGRGDGGFTFIKDSCLDGLDVALSELVAKKLKKNLVIINIPFAELVGLLNIGKIDMVISQMNQTSYRSYLMEQIPYAKNKSDDTFTLSILTTTYNEIKNNVRNNDYLSVLNTNNKQSGICVFRGSVQEHYLMAVKNHGSIPNLAIILVGNVNEAINLIKNGYASGLMQDSLTTITNNDITNVQTSITIDNEKIGDYSIGINSQNTELVENVAKFIKKLAKSKILAKLATRYLNTIRSSPIVATFFENLGNEDLF